MTLCLSCWIPGNRAYAAAAAVSASPNAEITAAETAASLQLSAGSNTVANTQPHTSSVQDLSIFGVISLGIMGLIWVRRHTTEL